MSKPLIIFRANGQEISFDTLSLSHADEMKVAALIPDAYPVNACTAIYWATQMPHYERSGKLARERIDISMQLLEGWGMKVIYPQDHLRKTKESAENGIIKEVIRNLIDAGYSISVTNEETQELSKSTSKSEVFKAMRQTATDALDAHDKDGTRVGCVQFVYGNDPWEVIADVSESLKEVIRPALARVSGVENRFLTTPRRT